MSTDMDLVRRLHEQLDWHWRGQARPRMDGLTDDEYLWEPAPGAWSLRRREEPSPPSANHRVGEGEWVCDYGFPEPTPAPFTTIAWRLAHVIVGVFGARNHSHFGGPVADYPTWDYAGSAEEALRQLDEGYAAWSAGVLALTEKDLLRPVGEAEGPWAAEPMLTLVLHINREAIHHLAEVALLRDLWAHKDRVAPPSTVMTEPLT
ncbi:DinB family protein [Ornithinimicrobium panacihumi]|uniref:DinB family protein n=1 Tax=Ornithinimicrobium panacihumi TaxID=2008449 RepID=UPI003F8C58B4